MKIDVNADVGESYGRWVLGDDAGLFPYVSSVNVACGFHAGDPAWMRSSVRLAKQHGLNLGAHPGFPDLGGFGRRMMALTDQEIVDICVYQTGALMGVAAAEGVRLTHVMAHGQLHEAMHQSPELVLKVADALTTMQEDLDLVLLFGRSVQELKKRGFSVRSMGVADFEFDDDGHIIPERRPKPVDPEEVAQRGVALANGILTTVSGKQLETEVDTITIHGDRPGAIEIGIALKRALSEAGIEVVAPK